MKATGNTVAEQAIEAAIWAPSVHNTQPWRFGVEDGLIALRADADRRITVADPDGREMLISCGAALYTLRVALRHLGHEPDVRLLPDPDRPHLLALVRIGPPTEPKDARSETDAAGAETAGAREEAEAGSYETDGGFYETDGESGHDRDRMYEEIFRRRTHRGAFHPDPVAAPVLAALRWDAEAEGARIVLAAESHVKAALAGLTQAADHLERRTPAYLREIARWAPRPGSTRRDGVHAAAYRRDDVRTEPHFPARDFARGQGWGIDDPAEPSGTVDDLLTGVVMLLVTGDDTPMDWLCAGQALQRILLRAGAMDDLSAAFHTQALEIPELRAFIRDRFCSGAHPQILLRLGVPAGKRLTSVRRPARAVTRQESHGPGKP
ncbi:hypothetical protein [Actinomadura gamaensis]|uniref:Nitroreductase n=1 Tax=Actinomadura gamaensis TaxID=1763541 RepID=A0ABV9TUZ1_9ACTN